MSFADTWEKATTDGSDNNTPPDEGAYEIAVIGASAFTSKKGAEIVKLELRVVSATHQGYEWTEIRSFGTQGAANAAKATCHRLGVDVDEIATLEDLDSALKETIGGYYAANVVRNGEYLNTYIEERLTGGSTGFQGADRSDFEPVSVPVDDEDVPF